MTRPRDWWKAAVIYQIYARSFADSNGDGVGDLRGVVEHVDHLVDLGVDAVWLSPFLVSPQVDNGYDISDYENVDRTYGTLEDLTDLIDTLHRHDIRFVMDLVLNHTSDEHAWFQSSRDARSRHSDWYVWRPPRPHQNGVGRRPNDWRSHFGGPAWTFDDERGEYYLHLFSRHQPDLNWENPAVRHAVHDVMRLWVERGVDGFRLDVINLISKPDGLPDIGPDRSTPHGAFNGPRLPEFLVEMNREVGLHARNILTVGEMPRVTTQLAERLTDPESEAVHMAIAFEHVELDHAEGGTKWETVDLTLPPLKQAFARWQDALADRGWNALYLDNHDQPRSVSRFGDDSREHRAASAKTLATILHLHRGTPFVYQGSEISMANPRFESISSYADVESQRYFWEAIASGTSEVDALRALARTSRDNARATMRWDESDHGGFTTGTPWIAAADELPGIDVATQRADGDSVYHHYRALIRLRRAHPIVLHGGFELLLADHDAIWAFTRTLGDATWLVVANCSSEPVDVPDDLPSDDGATVVLASHRDADPGRLRPWESRIVQLRGGDVGDRPDRPAAPHPGAPTRAREPGDD